MATIWIDELAEIPLEAWDRVVKHHKQLIKHDPATGAYGDCHRTCYACLLDLPSPDRVPNFYGYNADVPNHVELKEKADKEIKAFLAQFGLSEVSIAFNGELTLEQVLEYMDKVNKGVSFILGCRSSTGCNHSVVVHNNKIHNPSDSTITGPMHTDDGLLWWLTFFIPAFMVTASE